MPVMRIFCEQRIHNDVIVGGRGEHSILLGRVCDSGRKRRVLFDADSNFVVLEVGKRGSGKSFGLGAALEAFATEAMDSSIANHGPYRRGVLLLDPLDIHWTAIYPVRESGSEHVREQYRLLEGWNDVQPERIRVNVYMPAGRSQPEDPGEFIPYYLPIADLLPEDLAVLYGTNLITEPPGMLIGELYDKVTRLGYVTRDGSVAPIADFALQDLINCTQDDEIQDNYSPQTIRAVRQRFLAWQRDELFQRVRGTPVTQLVCPGTLSILCLNRLSEDMRSVLTGVVVRKMKAERTRASQAERRAAYDPSPPGGDHPCMPRTILAIDEAQMILPASGGGLARQAIESYILEGRNFGLSIWMATQRPRGAISSRAISQLDTIIVHKLSNADDVSAVCSHFQSELPRKMKVNDQDVNIDGLIRSLDVGMALVSSDTGTAHRAFVMEGRPRVVSHGGKAF